MTRFNMTSNVSLGSAIAIMSGCLMLGVIIGLNTAGVGLNTQQDHNSSTANLRTGSTSKMQQQQKAAKGGFAMPSKMPDPDTFSRAAVPSTTDKLNEEPAELGDFMWDGNFVAYQQALDVADMSEAAVMSMDFSFFFSYDY